jgi:hypothetical protein
MAAQLMCQQPGEIIYSISFETLSEENHIFVKPCLRDEDGLAECNKKIR